MLGFGERKEHGDNRAEVSRIAPDFEVFLVFDSKVGCYEMPMYAINQHDIVRQFTNLFRDPKESQNKFLVNAEDYAIFKCGSYSKKAGQLMTHPLEHVANLQDLRSLAQKMGIGAT